jgi:Sulfotransferase domain
MKQAPNFFIIGAPKCGTTSLATWLSEHPNIYFSPIKEPHFFNSDQNYNNVRSRKEYERLFNKVSAEHRAVGEGSVFYLYSKVAVSRIEKELPSSRYIVMFRNPIEMAYAMHEQQVFAGNEHITDFRRAWSLSDERLQGREVSQVCREPKLLAYKQLCALGAQLERLYAAVPRERVLVLFLDDFKKDSRPEYLRVLDFLDVPRDERTDFPVYNPAKERRWPGVRSAVQQANQLRRKLGLPRLGLGLIGAVEKANTKARAREKMPEDLKQELARYFLKDVQVLETLAHRDLSTWLKAGSPRDVPEPSLQQSLR